MKISIGLGQGEKVFESFIQIGSKGNPGKATVFSNYTRGIETGREFWVYNSSGEKVARNMEMMSSFYNAEEQRFKASGSNAGASSFVSNDLQKVKWTSSLISRLERGERAEFQPDKLVISGYRPFFKQTLFYSDFFIHRMGKWPIIFPSKKMENRVIITPGIGGGGDFSPLMSNLVFSLQPNHGTQCFPLKLYEPASADDGLFATGETGYTERDGISDAGLKHFQRRLCGRADQQGRPVLLHLWPAAFPRLSRAVQEQPVQRTPPHPRRQDRRRFLGVLQGWSGRWATCMCTTKPSNPTPS